MKNGKTANTWRTFKFVFFAKNADRSVRIRKCLKVRHVFAVFPFFMHSVADFIKLGQQIVGSVSRKVSAETLRETEPTIC